MDKNIELYKKFMEGLLENRTDLYAQNLRTGKRVFPAVDEERMRDFCNSLSGESKIILADIIQQTRDSAIFDVLEYLDESIYLHELKITQNGVEFPNDFWGGDFHCDWAGLCQGDMWGEDRK
ncbi:MAG: hypothetical protein FWD00_00635 [Clostridiales bacterium]|nr:hypothetical protein [Clostridiales bacterium]